MIEEHHSRTPSSLQVAFNILTANGLYPHVLLQGESPRLILRGLTYIFHDYDEPFAAQNTLFYALQSIYHPAGKANSRSDMPWTVLAADAISVFSGMPAEIAWFWLMAPIAKERGWKTARFQGAPCYETLTARVSYPLGGYLCPLTVPSTPLSPATVEDMTAAYPWLRAWFHAPGFSLPEGVKIVVDRGIGLEFTVDHMGYVNPPRLEELHQ